jgi:hypothetical protein
MNLSGEEFNKLYSNIQFVKLTNKNEIHRNIRYKTGLNVDPIQFNSSAACCPGGFHFCDSNNFVYWLVYVEIPMYYIRNIIIPNDALVYIEIDSDDPVRTKMKTSKFILEEKTEIKLMNEWFDNIFCEKAIKQSCWCFTLIQNKTPEICLEAIKQNGGMLEFVENQTEELCLEAVKQNGYAVKHVIIQTKEICETALKQELKASKYITINLEYN